MLVNTAGLIGVLGCSTFASFQAAETPFDLQRCENLQAAGNMKYCDLQVGSGDPPVRGDLIQVNYTARALDTGKLACETELKLKCFQYKTPCTT